MADTADAASQQGGGPLFFYLDYRISHPDEPSTVIYAKMTENRGRFGWPSLHSECRYRTIYRQLSPTLRLHLEKGRKVRFEKYGTIIPQTVGGANETWHIDAKTLSTYVLDVASGKVIRPSVITFIDHATRLVMGWTVCRESPTARDLLRALRHALLPANDKRWFARPRRIVFDNGPIHKADDFLDALTAMAVRVEANALHLSGSQWDQNAEDARALLARFPAGASADPTTPKV